MRFVDDQGKDLIERKDRIWLLGDTAARMCEAMQASKTTPPSYLQLLASQVPVSDQQQAIFSMHCYWEGEAMIGGIDGVLNTHAAWIGDKEVVRVHFDPQVVSYQTLVQASQKVKCATNVFALTDEQFETAQSIVGDESIRMTSGHAFQPVKDSEQKYHLRQTLYRHLPLTTLQSTRLNAYVRQNKSDAEIKSLLSPSQIELLEQIRSACQANPTALSNSVFPDDDSKLAAYQSQLSERLRNIR